MGFWSFQIVPSGPEYGESVVLLRANSYSVRPPEKGTLNTYQEIEKRALFQARRLRTRRGFRLSDHICLVFADVQGNAKHLAPPRARLCRNGPCGGTRGSTVRRVFYQLWPLSPKPRIFPHVARADVLKALRPLCRLSLPFPFFLSTGFFAAES
ncbi:hypothetical protein MPH_04389 [Macrophomina phaseolina MS6]|uniref:Uncharacterized protein n=1 Tax=Macrophomina phaseolina (strain MS6) TaxID=1126212 RepID=K2RUA8_MACPH|nr:hypothetical protein MPH_04389 [Macrophomina phaseolina MS6]